MAPFAEKCVPIMKTIVGYRKENKMDYSKCTLKELNQIRNDIVNEEDRRLDEFFKNIDVGSILRYKNTRPDYKLEAIVVGYRYCYSNSYEEELDGIEVLLYHKDETGSIDRVEFRVEDYSVNLIDQFELTGEKAWHNEAYGYNDILRKFVELAIS